MSIVYILTNQSMPGLIKIGKTENNVSQRMSELSNTSVPLPFECYYAARVEDNAAVEKSFHKAFEDFRVNPSREFFKMDPYKAKIILQLLAKEDVTPKDNPAIDIETEKALDKVSKSGKFNFKSFGIPFGATLHYVSDPLVTCTVNDERTVNFQGQIVSTSRAAVLANASRGGLATSLQGPIWWLYEDETLSNRRERLSSD
jgi:hypothetical protein